MTIALHTDLFRSYTLEKALGFISSAGFKAIELNAIPYWSPHVDFSKASEDELNRAKEIIKQKEIEVIAISANTELAVLSKSERKRAVDYCKKAMRFGAGLGSPVICTYFSGNTLLSSSRQRNALRDSLLELAQVAEETGCKIAIEHHHGNFVNTTSQALDIIAELNLPQVGFLFCLPHIVTYCKEDWRWALKLSKDYIYHVHIADTPVSLQDHKHLLPNNGEVDIQGFVQALEDIGYKGSCALQIYSEDADPFESACRGKEIMGSILKGIKNKNGI